MCQIKILSIAFLLSGISVINVLGSDVSIIVDENQKYISGTGEVTYPIAIDHIDNIKAFSITLKYTGDFETLKYDPSNYLHEPLILPLKIDKINRTITITGSATDKVVTRESSGTLGNLVFNEGANVSLFELTEAEYVDEKYRLVPIIAKEPIKQRDEAKESNSSISENYETMLNDAFPNPANPSTTISFSIKDQEKVSLKIYSVNGQLVRTLVDKNLGRGKYSIEWDGRDNWGNIVTSGIYFYKFIAGDYSSTKKIVIIK